LLNLTVLLDEILSNLDAGASILTTLPAKLSLHGVEKELMLNLRVSAVSDSAIAVSTTQPVLVRAANFNMVDNVLDIA